MAKIINYEVPNGCSSFLSARPFVCGKFGAATGIPFPAAPNNIAGSVLAQVPMALCRKQKSHDTDVFGRRSYEIKKKVIISFLSTLNHELLQINTVPWRKPLLYVIDLTRANNFSLGITF
jgi:hypothetical protein